MDCETIKTHFIEACKNIIINKKNTINTQCKDLQKYYELYCNYKPNSINPSNR